MTTNWLWGWWWPWITKIYTWIRSRNSSGSKPTHPLRGAKRLSFGACTLVEGGVQALPKLTFPGGALIGDGAGFLDAAKNKGIHNALRSGRIAAEAIFQGLVNGV